MSVPTRLAGTHDGCGGTVELRPATHRRELLAGQTVTLTAVCSHCGQELAVRYSLLDGIVGAASGTAARISVEGMSESHLDVSHLDDVPALAIAAGAEEMHVVAATVAGATSTEHQELAAPAVATLDGGERTLRAVPDGGDVEVERRDEPRASGDGEQAYVEHFADRFAAARDAVRRVREELPNLLTSDTEWSRPRLAVDLDALAAARDEAAAARAREAAARAALLEAAERPEPEAWSPSVEPAYAHPSGQGTLDAQVAGAMPVEQEAVVPVAYVPQEHVVAAAGIVAVQAVEIEQPAVEPSHDVWSQMTPPAGAPEFPTLAAPVELVDIEESATALHPEAVALEEPSPYAALVAEPPAPSQASGHAPTAPAAPAFNGAPGPAGPAPAAAGDGIAPDAARGFDWGDGGGPASSYAERVDGDVASPAVGSRAFGASSIAIVLVLLAVAAAAALFVVRGVLPNSATAPVPALNTPASSNPATSPGTGPATDASKPPTTSTGSEGLNAGTEPADTPAQPAPRTKADPFG